MASVSILLATYNGQRYIGEQLGSLARQTVVPAEVIVVDDGSADGTLEVVERFAREAPFPVAIHRNAARLGYRASFVQAMALCRSDLIAFCDQDDLWEPEKLERAAAAFDDPETVLFFHAAWLIGKSGERLGPADIFPCPETVPPLTHHSLTSPYGFSMVFRRELTQFTDLWDQSVMSGERNQPMSHDQWIYFLASVFGTTICSGARLVGYRQHGHNAVGYNLKSSLRSRLGRLLLFFRNENTSLLLLAEAASARARILGACRQRLTGVWQERAAAGEQHCSQLSRWLSQRAGIYDRTSPLRPRAIIARLLRERAYADHGGWGLGSSPLTKDIGCGVLLRRFLISPARFEQLRQRRPAA